jgi:hypothetical protein
MRSVALTVVAIVALSVAASAQVLAGTGDTTCGLAGNWMSIGCIHGQTQTRAYAEWDNLSLFMTSTLVAQGGTVVHMVNSSTGTTCGAPSVSVGLKYGGTAGDFYEWYTASVNTAGQYFDVLGAYTAAQDGSHHTYQILFIGNYSPDGSGEFQTIVDDLAPATRWAHTWDYEGRDGMCLSRVGINSNFAPSSSWSTGLFRATNLIWRDQSNANHSGWNLSQYWIEQPCGTAPCLNGGYVGATRWDSNTP